MTNQLRAKKGGEVGANGEWYEGGKFIATTDKYGKGIAKKPKARKVEIEPYKWELPPSEDAISLWGSIREWTRFTENGLEIWKDLPEEAIEFYKLDLSVITRLTQAFNSGQRWIEF